MNVKNLDAINCGFIVDFTKFQIDKKEKEREGCYGLKKF
jgi:hypothetical protein